MPMIHPSEVTLMSRTRIARLALLLALFLVAICRPLLAQPQNAAAEVTPSLRVTRDVSVTMRDGVVSDPYRDWA